MLYSLKFVIYYWIFFHSLCCFSDWIFHPAPWLKSNPRTLQTARAVWSVTWSNSGQSDQKCLRQRCGSAPTDQGPSAVSTSDLVVSEPPRSPLVLSLLCYNMAAAGPDFIAGWTCLSHTETRDAATAVRRRPHLPRIRLSAVGTRDRWGGAATGAGRWTNDGALSAISRQAWFMQLGAGRNWGCSGVGRGQDGQSWGWRYVGCRGTTLWGACWRQLITTGAPR